MLATENLLKLGWTPCRCHPVNQDMVDNSCLNFISDNCSRFSLPFFPGSYCSSATSHVNFSAFLNISFHCTSKHLCHLCTLNWLLSFPLGLITPLETYLFNSELLCVKDELCHSCVHILLPVFKILKYSEKQRHMCLLTENVLKVLQKRGDEFCNVSVNSV